MAFYNYESSMLKFYIKEVPRFVMMIKISLKFTPNYTPAYI